MNEKKKAKLKDVEIRIVAELMKNSRRSDREIALAVGVSQPTVSRTIEKLEKEGVIKEYTMIPDFSRLGYEIMGSTQFELREEPFEDRVKAREAIIDKHAGLVAVEGINRTQNRLVVNVYENYTEYSETMSFLKRIPIVNAGNVDSFMVSLENQANVRFLSMSALATNLLSQVRKNK